MCSLLVQCWEGGERRYPRHRRGPAPAARWTHGQAALHRLTHPSPAAAVSALFQGKDRCSPATQILSYYLKTHPNRGETKYVAIKIFVFTKSTFSNVLQENPSLVHYSWEQWILGQVCTAWVRVHVDMIHLWLYWLTSNTFLYPFSSRCTPTNRFPFKSVGQEKKVSSICRNSYAHHPINLPSCHCGVTRQNSAFGKSHVRN